jgi:predicted DNA-binding protein YlxM (UPF0122 family)
MDRSKNRSDSYQHKIVEAACSPDMLMEVADSEGIGAQLNPFGYNEDLLDLKDQLRDHFWKMVREKLTPRQREVIELYCNDYTQTEIAKKLGVNQSSITKSMNGNCDYRNGKKIYGGAKKKLQKIAENDQDIQDILFKISEIQEE